MRSINTKTSGTGLRVIVKSVLSATIRERSMHGSKSARFKALRPIAGACLAVESVTAWASELQLLRESPAGTDVPESGRAAGRGGVCQTGASSGVAGSLKKKKG